jgi:hypothetical protein
VFHDEMCRCRYFRYPLVNKHSYQTWWCSIVM